MRTFIGKCQHSEIENLDRSPIKRTSWSLRGKDNLCWADRTVNLWPPGFDPRWPFVTIWGHKISAQATRSCVSTPPAPCTISVRWARKHQHNHNENNAGDQRHEQDGPPVGFAMLSGVPMMSMEPSTDMSHNSSLSPLWHTFILSRLPASESPSRLIVASNNQVRHSKGAPIFERPRPGEQRACL